MLTIAGERVSEPASGWMSVEGAERERKLGDRKKQQQQQ